MDARVDTTSRLEAGEGGCCRLCGSRLNETFVHLGMQPLCESFVAAEDADAMEPHYPLHAFVCEECFLVQLNEYVSPEAIFGEYAYFSSYSSSWVAHAKAYCEMITTRLGLGAGSLAVEIASNDGYLLQHFAPLGVPCLGIEPAANVAAVAIGKGVPTRVDFFGAAFAEKLVGEGLRADLIAGNNVLAQVPDLNDFVAGFPILLKPEGVVTLEFPHLVRLMQENQFDTIYHEHFSYFSLIVIERLAGRHGLKLFDVEELTTHGGSLRVYLAHAGSSHAVTDRVGAVLAEERRLGLDGLTAYRDFAAAVERTKRDILAFLIAAKNAGRTVVGYGAPGKGNTLLNYCGIGPDFLDFTVDRNPYKHGRFTPGRRIPIKPVDELMAAKPDYVFILPWNLKTEIVKQMAGIAAWGGQFVVPIPGITVIDPKDMRT